MNRKILIIGICILFFTIVTFAYIALSDSIPSGRLIVMNDAINNDNLIDGISVIDLKTNKTDIINQTGRYSSMDYCKSRNSIYAVSTESQIYEINLDSKKTTPVGLRVEKGELRKYEYLKCVPGKNQISYSISGTVFLYDFHTQKESILITDCHDYSWNKDGTKVIYGNKIDMLIHEYSLAAKKDRNLEIDGYAPQYSPDEKYLVFDKYKGSSTYPCVMRISDGYEWIYENSNVWQMQFSKDASKLLLCEPNNNSFDQSIQQLVFWDYKNEKVKRLQIVYRSNSPFLLFK